MNHIWLVSCSHLFTFHCSQCAMHASFHFLIFNSLDFVCTKCKLRTLATHHCIIADFRKISRWWENEMVNKWEWQNSLAHSTIRREKNFILSFFASNVVFYCNSIGISMNVECENYRGKYWWSASLTLQLMKIEQNRWESVLIELCVYFHLHWQWTQTMSMLLKLYISIIDSFVFKFKTLDIYCVLLLFFFHRSFWDAFSGWNGWCDRYKKNFRSF